MLTAAQCRVAAYTTPWGEFYCPECTVARLEEDGGPGVEGFESVIEYSLDEYVSERSADLRDGSFDEEWPKCTDDCEPFGLYCDSCSTELVEPYHYGHAEDDDEDV